MRCAVYARYSSDRQSPQSIQDQLRKCREYATVHDWEVLPEHVYTDEAQSGAGADRPGLLQLMAMASRAPKAFDVVLLDDTSRLSRNQGETARIVERLSFLGVRLVAVSQGIDTQHDQADVLLTVHGLVDSLYIKELAKKTHRGLEGKVLRGLHAGGRCFGYDNATTADGVRLHVNDQEAAVVREIFGMAADGCSLRSIAKRLNKRGVPPARPRAGKKYATWCPSAIRAMLRRELYTGKIVWNKSRFVKQPGTNKRLRRARPPHEWTTTTDPTLRIIDDQTWDRVQQHILSVQEQYGHPGLARGARTPYLLTGLLKCATCGANLVIVTGRGKSAHPSYGCPQNFYRGACQNHLKVRQDRLEERFLDGLQTAITQPDAVQYAVTALQRALQERLAALQHHLERTNQRKHELEKELANLIATVAACGPTPALTTAITEREQELKTLTNQVFSPAAGIAPNIDDLQAFITERVANISSLLRKDVERAKNELQKHASSITMTPTDDHYTASGTWNLIGSGGEAMRVWMVAGGGFEPPTFGL